MASSSKGQGLQIALIVFVVLTVAMSVTWFIFYQKATELGTKLVAAEDVKKKADTDKATAIRQLGTLKAKIGYPDAEFGNDSPPDAPGGATVMSKVAEDLQKYAPKDQAADPNPTYTARLAGLQRVLDNTEQQLTALTQKYQTLQAEFDKQRSVEAAKIAEHDAAMQAANTDRDRVEKDTGAQMAALLLEQQAALTQSQLQTTKAE
jgi:type II secretory pathway pseudopilin PulG